MRGGPDGEVPPAWSAGSGRSYANMAVVLILILASLSLAGGFLLAFLWAVRAGQFEDARTPALRILTEDKAPRPQPRHTPARDG